MPAFPDEARKSGSTGKSIHGFPWKMLNMRENAWSFVENQTLDICSNYFGSSGTGAKTAVVQETLTSSFVTMNGTWTSNGQIEM